MTRRRLLVGSLAGLAFLVGAVEWYLGFAGIPPEEPRYQALLGRPLTQWEEDDWRLQWRFRANRQAVFWSEGLRRTLTVGQSRLRGPVPEIGEGGSRILALGGSRTLGWEVDDANTYPVRLQSALTAALGREVSVINGGARGYSSEQQRRVLPELLSYEPEVLLLEPWTHDGEKSAVTDRVLLARMAPKLGPGFWSLRIYQTSIHWRVMRAIRSARAAGQETVRVLPPRSDENLSAMLTAARGAGASVAVLVSGEASATRARNLRAERVFVVEGDAIPLDEIQPWVSARLRESRLPTPARP